MKLSELLVGAAVGAGLMYLFDPHAGNYRRGLVRDQLAEARGQAANRLDDAREDARHLFNEVAAEIAAQAGNDPDYVLHDRIRAALEQRIPYARSIQIEVERGCATLRGPILSHDLLPVLTAARAARGITSVESQLDVHHTPANTPELRSAALSTPKST